MKFNRGKQDERLLQDNVAREVAQGVLLRCGHSVRSVPVAVFPGRRKMFRCPECGLQSEKKRH